MSEASSNPVPITGTSIIGSDLYNYATGGILRENVVYDKVINLLFIRADGTKFSIRSDWEVMKTKEGQYDIIKCRQKPEIRVEYKQVSTDVVISVNIYVTNLHLVTATAQGSNQDFLTFESNPIETIIVQQGYFYQFPDFSKDLFNSSDEELDAFFELKDPRTVRPYAQMSLQVLAVYPTSNPPDGQTLFYCVVGDIKNGYYRVPAANPSTEVENADANGDFKDAESYFFSQITKHFFRKTWGSFVVPPGGILEGQGSVKVKTADGKTDKEVQFYGELKKDAAEKYGVLCLITPTVKTLMESTLKDTQSAAELKVPVYDSLLKAVSWMQTTFPFLRFLQMSDGNLTVYSVTPEESVEDVHKIVMAKYGDQYNFLTSLPAVESISYGGLRSITIPFVPNLFPFMKLSFSSRYNLANMVGYFYHPKKGDEVFFIISYECQFDTAGDANKMTLMTTDAEGGEG
jgi:hypothetical protein